MQLEASASERIDVCGLPVDSTSLDEVVARVLECCARPHGDRPLSIFSCNVDMVVKAARDPAFAATLGAADILTADGMPIVWLGRALGGAFPERVTGADLLPRIAAACSKVGHSLFLLGAAEGVAAEAARRLQAAHPGLRVAGTLAPAPGFDRADETLRPVIEAVRASKADVLFVALGAPRQERLILEHGASMGVKVALGVGAAIDMAAGRVARAPAFVQRAGAEWLWRLVQEPRRLARRYLVEDLAFFPIAWRELRKGDR